jgi:hypothetical protein
MANHGKSSSICEGTFFIFPNNVQKIIMCNLLKKTMIYNFLDLNIFSLKLNYDNIIKTFSI